MKPESWGEQNGIPEEFRDAGKYEKFEKICAECGSGFTLNIPKSWFDENGEIKERNLPPGVSFTSVQASLQDTICPNCRNKEQIAKAALANE